MSGEFDKAEAERLAMALLNLNGHLQSNWVDAAAQQLRAAIERVTDLERIQSNWETLAEQYLDRATKAEDLALQACDWLEARTDKQARTFHAAHIRAALAKEDT